jgi:hypothetical protein
VERLGHFLLAASGGTVPPEMPRAFVLSGNRPNPFNPATTISFDLPADGEVTLSVFDVSGREVAHPLRGEPLGPGRHEILFHGVDDSGVHLASGIYFYRLNWRDRSALAKMVLLK